MNQSAKSQILDLLTKDKGIETPPKVPDSQKATCVIIHGHALIQARGKPQGCQTFGDFAEGFVQSVYSNFKGPTSRVDVDRYIGTKSIKQSTRKKRSGKRQPIRKQITSPDVPLPHIWDQYIVLDENKKDLADFLSTELLRQSNTLSEDSVIVAGGGLDDITNTKSNGHRVDHLAVDQEEADTRMSLQAKDAIGNGFKRIKVICRDTYVLLLLMYHTGNDVETWMVSGTAKQRRCYPVHTICDSFGEDFCKNVLGFHGATGCDTTSSFHGVSKKSCWKLFLQEPTLLASVGHGVVMEDIESYLCRLYGCSLKSEHLPDVDTCRYRLFMKAKKALELLPPTKDALELHLNRANYQAKLWLHACDASFELEDPTTTAGWREDNGTLVPIWMRQPAVPSACMQLVSRNCKTKCSSARCACYKSRQVCLYECGCEATGCANPMSNSS